MHSQDPVNWQLWNADILKHAQQQNKLIFISSGYFSCHWCHVMQHENYQNPQTAALLNQHFIAVKIDRELNPELDKTLIDFAQQHTGQAGWPQHVILTPSGYPFTAFIYLPNKAFNQRLKKIATLWNNQTKEIETLAKQAFTQKQKQTQFKHTDTPINLNDFRHKLLQHVEQAMDELSGGLKGSSKFPEAPLLNTLLTIKPLPTAIEEWLILTLEQMQSEHLFDHIHGGFYRYTVDPNWQTPHFEKMAYTNALLAQTYLTAGKRYQRHDFTETAQKTLDYLQHHLYSPNTKMYMSSQSALDKQNREGGNYLWSQQRLENQLSDDEYQAIYQAWSLFQTPPFELGWLPKPFESEVLWRRVQSKLITAKQQIPTDQKSILAWNGLILSALSQAYGTLQETAYLQQAEQLAKQLASLLYQANPPRALSQSGQFMGKATLQDYAYIKKGLQDYQAWSNDRQFASTITHITQTIATEFYNANGWQYDANPVLMQQAEWVMADGPMPSLTALSSCLQPASISKAQHELMANPIQYASYLTEINCNATSFINDINPK
ncbi:MAG: DUF255 domain-containing protein [Thiomicrorhabdus sp.]|nr:DUF255 domain-containing protein [Thiomicrorhabdus sp.]